MTAATVDRISPVFGGDGEIDWPALLTQALTLPGQMGNTYNRFYRYSFLNQLLLLAQGVTEPCASFKVWKNLGRIPVAGGGRYVRHPAPIKKTDKKTGEETTFTRFYCRRSAFPYSNTVGPEIEWPELPKWDWQRALAALDIEQVPFEWIDGNAQGYSIDRKVAVSPVAVYPLKTGFHEMGHVVLGHTTDETVDGLAEGEQLCRGVREFQAESVAYLLAHETGLTEWASEESRAYIQGWLGNEEVTDAHIRAVFTATDKILTAGRAASATDETAGDVRRRPRPRARQRPATGETPRHSRSGPGRAGPLILALWPAFWPAPPPHPAPGWGGGALRVWGSECLVSAALVTCRWVPVWSVV